MGRVTLDIQRKMQARCLEKCFKVGKLTKIWAKLTKTEGAALAEVGEMCKKLEKLRQKRGKETKGERGKVGGGAETALYALVHILEQNVRVLANVSSICVRF